MSATNYRIPSLVALAFEAGRGEAACDSLSAHVAGALVSRDADLVADIRWMIARVAYWLADTGVAYSAEDEDRILGFLALLDRHGAKL